jgi:hypothetical protein
MLPLRKRLREPLISTDVLSVDTTYGAPPRSSNFRIVDEPFVAAVSRRAPAP